MSDLVKWNGGNDSTPAPITKWGETRAIASVQRRGNITAQRMMVEGQHDILRVDIAAGITQHSMQRVVDLDAERRNLAGNDETLNAQLAHLQMGFINTCSGIIRRQGR